MNPRLVYVVCTSTNRVSHLRHKNILRRMLFRQKIFVIVTPIFYTTIAMQCLLPQNCLENCMRVKVLDDEFESFLTEGNLSKIQEDVLSYIAGFMCRKVHVQSKCKFCASLLVATVKDGKSLDLIKCKDRGGLYYPSDDLIKVCKLAENALQGEMVKENFISNENILKKLGVKVSTCVHTQHPNIFAAANHEAMHKYDLVKTICRVYLSIRLKHIAREKNENIKRNKMRKKLSRLIIFKHQ